MNRVFSKTTRSARFGFAALSNGGLRSRKVDRRRRGRLFDVMEDRTLLTTMNSVVNLQGLAISAVQGISTTQDVATFNDVDSTAVPTDFTATITWPGGASSAGTVTEDASNLFHVTGT